MEASYGWAIWLTGLPASGKTTIANSLRSKLETLGVKAFVLDSDLLRGELGADTKEDYRGKERQHFYDTMVKIAEEKTSLGINVIISATGNKRSYREEARQKLTTFAEISVFAPIEVAIARDAKRNPDGKGLYAKAYDNETSNFPGVQAPYEAPDAPDVVIDTRRMDADEAAKYILASIDFLTREAPVMREKIIAERQIALLKEYSVGLEQAKYHAGIIWQTAAVFLSLSLGGLTYVAGLEFTGDIISSIAIIIIVSIRHYR